MKQPDVAPAIAGSTDVTVLGENRSMYRAAGRRIGCRAAVQDDHQHGREQRPAEQFESERLRFVSYVQLLRRCAARERADRRARAAIRCAWPDATALWK